jgi:tetratricopeptide (TPR) repeat protein
LGYIAWVLGEYMLAKQLHQESLVLHREAGDQRGVAYSLNCLAGDVAGLAEYGEAKQIWEESLVIFQEIGHLWGIQTVVGNLGELANFLGEYAEAIQLAQECLTISRKIDERSGIAWALRILGNATLELGDLPGAKRYLHQALEVITTVGQTLYIPLNLVGIGALLAREGEQERSLEVLSLVLHHPMSWQWAKDKASPLVAELEAELSPDAVAAAQERGRARDLEATVAELLDDLGG